MPVECQVRALPGGQLRPASPADAEELETDLRPGEAYRVTLTLERNPRNHRRFFAMLRLAYQFEQISEQFPSREHFRRSLIIAAGHYEEAPGFDPETGKAVIWLHPKSLRFSRMEETEFRRLFSDCINALLWFYLVGQDEAELERQFNEILEFG